MTDGDRFAMEVWHDAGWVRGDRGDGSTYPEAGWERMDRFKGSAATWRPRPTANQAVRKCLTWTGLTGIPTMRVVDLLAGEQVVWQFGRRDDIAAGAGPNILPWWAQAQMVAARMALAGQPPPTEQPPAPGQETLW